MSLIAIEDLCLTIGDSKILKSINLSLSAKETLGIVGESGSGKSMTAYSIMRLLPRGARLSGSIRFDGVNLLREREREMEARRGRDMALVFQEPMTALNPLQRIGDQVAEMFRIHRNLSRPAALAAAEAALAEVGLKPPAVPMTKFPHQLSGGQRQRVVIAMAVALRPKLLIADEPTTALDVTTQEEILQLLKSLAAEAGAGLIFITHDLAVVASIADRIAVMKDGEIVEFGETGALLSNMRHPYTRALFAAANYRRVRRAAPRVDSAPVLQVEGVSRLYRQSADGGLFSRRLVHAVDDVSLKIAIGENVGLVGESGCGKSTLARTILALERPQMGRVLIKGENLTAARGRRQRALRRGIQVVFQDPYGSFDPRQRVETLVGEPFHLLDETLTTSQKRARVAAMLERVGLSAADAQKYPHEFSGGQRQRIAIARALITNPSVVVLDEATSALDVSIRAQILDLLASLSDDLGLSYLFISHDLSTVRSMTDRVLIMKEGRIVEEGPTEEVFSNPRHPYTELLIRATPKLPVAAS